MSSQEVFLNWDNHHDTLVSIFEKLLESNSLVDCTITSEGKIMKAHRIVLSACSSFFQMLFSQESEKHPIVVFTDIKYRELKSIIEYMYHGKVEIPTDQLDLFMKTAATLQIRGLTSNHIRQEGEEIRSSDSLLCMPSSEQTSSLPNLHKRRKKSSLNSCKENSHDLVEIYNSKKKTKDCRFSSHDVVNQNTNHFHSAHAAVSPHSSFFRTTTAGNMHPVRTENKNIKNYSTRVSPSLSPSQLETQIIEDVELEPITEIFLPELVETEERSKVEKTCNPNCEEIVFKKCSASKEVHDDASVTNQYTCYQEESKSGTIQKVEGNLGSPAHLQAILKDPCQKQVLSKKQKTRKPRKQQLSQLVQDENIFPPIQIHSVYTCEDFNQFTDNKNQPEDGSLMSSLTVNPMPVQEIIELSPEAYSVSDFAVSQNLIAPVGHENNSTIPSSSEMHTFQLVSPASFNPSNSVVPPLSAESTNLETVFSTPISSIAIHSSITSIAPFISAINSAPVGIPTNSSLIENPAMNKISNLSDVGIAPPTDEGTSYAVIKLQSEIRKNCVNINPQIEKRTSYIDMNPLTEKIINSVDADPQIEKTRSYIDTNQPPGKRVRQVDISPHSNEETSCIDNNLVRKSASYLNINLQSDKWINYIDINPQSEKRINYVNHNPQSAKRMCYVDNPHSEKMESCVDTNSQSVKNTSLINNNLQSNERRSNMSNTSQSAEVLKPWRFSRLDRHSCSKCNQSFRSAYLLGIHMLKHGD